MERTSRLFELIQTLRAATGPLTAERLAETLEVSVRTVYRDMASLQAMRVPVEGASGLGYVLRRGYDLPPLNFDTEEIEALRVGLAMLARTGDTSLEQAARRVCDKVEALHGPSDWLVVSPWGAPRDDPALGCVSKALLRDAIRAERKLELVYKDSEGTETRRIVRPLAVNYHIECVMLAAWCELRGTFRHFRCDRIESCTVLDACFAGQGATLRSLWAEQEAGNNAAPPAA
ncbi:helix-turn-helix transcriptional regulator [Puniceibacterium sediminis]|uniref:Predicted DNA-binding transcriptional regulator YafY, contains an HTH and WYL domains n=1 Tax=Puniceibacterium sediminis TaxID=1608407 RepID=A0A238VGS8_9RHOB|nr:YafY family protein [Puniceibacterium sediminis]SNR32719.1 Predicted DNA-binding transcriptional regulator YafY, contains an HTH and WYL domains [Puniceibacterium sediminis]